MFGEAKGQPSVKETHRRVLNGAEPPPPPPPALLLYQQASTSLPVFAVLAPHLQELWLGYTPVPWQFLSLRGGSRGPERGEQRLLRRASR